MRRKARSGRQDDAAARASQQPVDRRIACRRRMKVEGSTPGTSQTRLHGCEVRSQLKHRATVFDEHAGMELRRTPYPVVRGCLVGYIATNAAVGH
jgi:hypothetical protein